MPSVVFNSFHQPVIFVTCTYAEEYVGSNVTSVDYFYVTNSTEQVLAWDSKISSALEKLSKFTRPENVLPCSQQLIACTKKLLKPGFKLTLTT
jgi:hypothetical protein